MILLPSVPDLPWRTWGVLTVGFALELAATTHLMLYGNEVAPLPFFTLHILGAQVMAFGFVLALPIVPERNWGRPLLFFFGLNLFVPLLGALGIAVAVLPSLHRPYQEKAVAPARTMDIPDLPFRPLIISAEPLYGGVGLVGVIRNAQDVSTRVRAVMAARQMADRYAIPVLSVALRDPIDDVRLLAYALLDSKERAIYEKIKKDSDLLKRTSPDQRGAIHKRLAQEHWELAYLGLAQGEVLAHVLEQALEHLRGAMELADDKDAGLHLLRARIFLKTGLADEAVQSLARCRQLGLPPATLIPYEAEAAFRQRRFDEIKSLFARMDAVHRDRPPLGPVISYWTAETSTEEPS